jgi:hypothetical protein
MEKNTINPEVLKERIEKMKNSNNPLLKRMVVSIEEKMNINTTILNK